MLTTRVLYGLEPFLDGLWCFDAKNATTAVETESQSPSEFSISDAYPNPFNITTTIEFNLQTAGAVKLFVYSITGQKIREIAAGNYNAGKHTAVWDGKDDSGNVVSSGVYIARLESGGRSAVAKMVMMK